MSELSVKYHENPFTRFFGNVEENVSDGLNMIPPPPPPPPPPVLQIIPSIFRYISWKFHENPPVRFPVMLLTDKQTHKQTN